MSRYSKMNRMIGRHTNKLANIIVRDYIESFDELPIDDFKEIFGGVIQEFEERKEFWKNYARTLAIHADMDALPEQIAHEVLMLFVDQWDMMEDYIRESRFSD